MERGRIGAYDEAGRAGENGGCHGCEVLEVLVLKVWSILILRGLTRAVKCKPSNHKVARLF